MSYIHLPPARPTPEIVWSPQQEAVFDWVKPRQTLVPATVPRNLIVRARAGTGKTSTIVEALKYAPEKKICLAAFNKVIAEDLKERVPPWVDVRTLHSLGLAFIRRAFPKVRIDAKGNRAWFLTDWGIHHFEQMTFAIADVELPAPDQDTRRNIVIMHTFLRERCALQIRKFDPDVQDIAFMAGIEAVLSAADVNYELAGNWAFSHCAHAATLAAWQAMQDTEEIDFADMLFLPLALNLVRPVYDLMVVDEAQDMTRQQLDLALAACVGRVILVGDDKQAIYGWRGADSGCLDRLKKQLMADELPLTVTYRCPKRVVKVAQQFVPDIRHSELANPGIAKENVEMDFLLANVAPGDFVLSRTNIDLIDLYWRIVNQGEPAILRGGDVGQRALRILKSFGVNTLPRVEHACNTWIREQRENILATAHLLTTEQRSGVERVYNDTKQTIALLDAFRQKARDYTHLLHLIKSSFTDAVSQNAITFSTVHKAKGLETDNVWLLGETFSAQDDEERNICYVAVTRARKCLYLVDASWEEIHRGREVPDYADFPGFLF